MGVLEPIDDGSVADRVAAELRRAIHAGSLPAGARLVERTLARELRTSHIPVREALARLAEEGLVERQPRRGARVAVLTAARLEELSSLRTVLEQFVVRRVQERWTPSIEAELRARVDDMVAAATAGDAGHIVDLDEAFHARLWRLAEHELLNEVAASVRGRVRAFLRAATLPLPVPELHRHAAVHSELVDAIASGDPLVAEGETARHIAIATARIRQAGLETSPESALTGHRAIASTTTSAATAPAAGASSGTTTGREEGAHR
jgi:DNA-binding GntR family transcriptional regulator